MAEIDWAQPEVLAQRLRAAAPSSCDPCRDPIGQIARALIVLRPGDTIRAVYGCVPDGLRGCLLRLGPDPLPTAWEYRQLFEMFSLPDQRRRAKLLTHTEGKISGGKLEAIRSLDAIVLHESVLPKLFCLEDAERLNATIRVIRDICSTATDDALRESVEQFDPAQALNEWAMRWIAKADRLPPAAIRDAAFKVLLPSELKATGRKWHNCLSNYIAMVSLGRCCFLEYSSQDGDCLIRLDRVTGGWVWHEAFARNNGLVPDKVQSHARSRLRAAGVLMPDHGPGRNADVTLALGLLDGVLDWPFKIDEGPVAALAALEDEGVV